MNIQELWASLDQEMPEDEPVRDFGVLEARKRRGPGPEKIVQDQILDYLRMRQLVHWRVNAGQFVVGEKGRKRRVTGAPTGTSDIVVCLPTGEFMTIEVKAPGGKPKAAQCDFMARVKASKGHAIVADNLDTVMDFIEPIVLESSAYMDWEPLAEALKDHYLTPKKVRQRRR